MQVKEGYIVLFTMLVAFWIWMRGNKKVDPASNASPTAMAPFFTNTGLTTSMNPCNRKYY